MKTIIVLFLTVLTAYSQTTTIKTQMPVQTKKSFFSDFSASYYVNFAGPKLSNPSSGETYSKWNTNPDAGGNRQDSDESINAYNSLSLRYQITKNISAQYSYVFQNYFNKKADYKSKQYSAFKKDKSGNFIKNKYGLYVYDGSRYTERTLRRDTSQDYYDQSLGFYFTNLMDNSLFNLSSGLTYVHPTTDSSRENNMQYSFIIDPNIRFKTNNYSITPGVMLNAQRYYYQRNEDTWFSRQTFTFAASPYLNYQMSDNMMLKTSLTFDWDQSGKQHGTNFNNNLDNVFNIGIGTSLLAKTYSYFYIEGSIEEVKTDHMFIGFNTTITL